MKISILLPLKENFSPSYAGAVSLFINDTLKFSQFKKSITVFGHTQYKKKFDRKYFNIDIKKNLFQSQNKEYVKRFIKKEKEINSDIIELHNRPIYLNYLVNELKDRDPEYYKTVDLDNPHRLIRALEVCISSNVPYSSFLGHNRPARPFKTLYIGLEAPRNIVYERINARVDLMMESGLLEEVTKLHAHKALNALQTVGYKELFEYIDGHCTLEFAVSEIKKNTRRFAKRQLTWLRKNEGILWVEYDAEPNKMIEQITNRLKTVTHA